MKKLSTACIVLLFLVTSCSKESQTGITGEWTNTAMYTDPANGGRGWETVNTAVHETVIFQADARFHVFTDVPAGAGIYHYDRNAHTLQLDFTDAGGNTNRSENRNVESISTDKLIVSYQVTGSPETYKTEYSRIR